MVTLVSHTGFSGPISFTGLRVSRFRFFILHRKTLNTPQDKYILFFSQKKWEIHVFLLVHCRLILGLLEQMVVLVSAPRSPNICHKQRFRFHKNVHIGANVTFFACNCMRSNRKMKWLYQDLCQNENFSCHI